MRTMITLLLTLPLFACGGESVTDRPVETLEDAGDEIAETIEDTTEDLEENIEEAIN